MRRIPGVELRKDQSWRWIFGAIHILGEMKDGAMDKVLHLRKEP